MKSKISILICCMLLSLSGKLFAQQVTKCGTKITPEQVARERASLPDDDVQRNFTGDYCIGKTFSITAHIIADSLGVYAQTEAAIISAINGLNTIFAPICVSFEVCQFNYIPNFKYYVLEKPLDQDELNNLYLVPNTINMFFCGRLFASINPPEEVGGYATLPTGEFMSIASMGSIPHEMGHFMGLYHTFETQFGPEFANGSNCTTTGDLVCDTPADPFGNLQNCELSPYTQDANGDWYVPAVWNTMSYYDGCGSGFSVGQYNRMSQQILQYRMNLW